MACKAYSQPSIIFDGCNKNFSVGTNAQECKKAVLSCHNVIRDELSDLASKALSSVAVRDDKPKIRTFCNSEVKSNQEKKENSVNHLFCYNSNENHGDIWIHGLLLGARDMDCIIEMLGLQMTMPSPTGRRR